MTLVLLPAGSVVAEEAPQPDQDQVAPQEDAMRVYKDPETGRLVAPPRHVREALAAAEKQRQDLNQSSEGLQARVLRDGTVTMDLQGRFQSHYVVTRGADGQLEHFCTDGELAFFEQLIADYHASLEEGARQQAAGQEVSNDR